MMETSYENESLVKVEAEFSQLGWLEKIPFGWLLPLDGAACNTMDLGQIREKPLLIFIQLF